MLEKERKDSKKRAKAWREMRKNVAYMKRHHEMTTPEDGRVLTEDDEYGFGRSQEG